MFDGKFVSALLAHAVLPSLCFAQPLLDPCAPKTNMVCNLEAGDEVTAPGAYLLQVGDTMLIEYWYPSNKSVGAFYKMTKLGMGGSPELQVSGPTLNANQCYDCKVRTTATITAVASGSATSLAVVQLSTHLGDHVFRIYVDDGSSATRGGEGPTPFSAYGDTGTCLDQHGSSATCCSPRATCKPRRLFRRCRCR